MAETEFKILEILVGRKLDVTWIKIFFYPLLAIRKHYTMASYNIKIEG